MDDRHAVLSLQLAVPEPTFSTKNRLGHLVDLQGKSLCINFQLSRDVPTCVMVRAIVAPVAGPASTALSSALADPLT